MSIWLWDDTTFPVLFHLHHKGSQKILATNWSQEQDPNTTQMGMCSLILYWKVLVLCLTVILNWFQLWEKPHAWANQPRPQLIKPAIKFGFKHLRRQKTHIVLTPNTWSETCITQRPGQTPEGIVLKRIDWGNFLHPFSAKRHNWTSDERLLEGLFDEENVEFGHLDTIKTHREARVRRDQSRKMSCRQHNRTFNITKIQLQRWRETGILWIF